MAEISGMSPSAQVVLSSRSQPSAAGVALELTRPLNGQIQPGDQLKAQVLEARAQAQAHLLTLKMALTNGRETTVQATSPRSFPAGHTLVLQVVASDRLSVSGGQPTQAFNRLDLAQAPVGTSMQLQVQSSQALANGQGFSLTVTVLNGPLAGQQLSLESSLKLAAGNLLNVTVQGAQQLSITPMAQRLEQAAILSQLNGQLGKQGSLDGLLTGLSSLNSATLPDGLKASINVLLGSINDMSQLSAKALAQALSNSGVFMESRLLAGLSVEHDVKAQLLRLVSQFQAALPAAAQSTQALSHAMPALLREAIERAQPKVAPSVFPLASRVLQNLDQEPDLQLLLRLAAAAVSRLQTHQLAGLNTQVDANGNLINTWQTEIPVRSGQEFSTVQVKVQSEEDGQSQAEKQPKTLWRIELAFNIEPLGPLQIKAQLADGALSGTLWAERELTGALIEREMSYLQNRLASQGVALKDFNCQVGVAPQGARTEISQHWVDEKV